MSVTPEFGWPLIEPTDFVTDLPADFEAFADAVDADVKLIKDTADAAIPETIIDAAGDLIYGTAADTAGVLTLGTAGQVLQVNSGETAPEWGTIAPDSMTVIATTNFNNTASVYTYSSLGSYKHLFILMQGIMVPAGAEDLRIQFNSDTGNNYAWATIGQTNNSPVYQSSTATSFIQVGVAAVSENNAATIRRGQVRFWVEDYRGSEYKSSYAITGNISANQPKTHISSGVWNNTAAITSLTVRTAAASNFSAGTLKLYGVS